MTYNFTEHPHHHEDYIFESGVEDFTFRQRAELQLEVLAEEEES